MAGRFAQLLLVGGSGHAEAPRADDEYASLFTTWRFASALPLEAAALRCALATLPASVVRAKGIVMLAHAPGRRFVLQVVGRRWSLEPEEADDGSALAGRSEIVVIGLAGQLDTDELRMLFAPALPAGVPSAVAEYLRQEDRA